MDRWTRNFQSHEILIANMLEWASVDTFKTMTREELERCIDHCAKTREWPPSTAKEFIDILVFVRRVMACEKEREVYLTSLPKTEDQIEEEREKVHKTYLKNISAIRQSLRRN